MTKNELGRDETTEADEVVDNSDRVEGESQTVLAMQESECRSVWSYTVDRKGASEELAIYQICENLETVGLNDDRIIVKDDQEPAIIDIATQIALNRGGRFGTAINRGEVEDQDYPQACSDAMAYLSCRISHYEMSDSAMGALHCK